MLLVELAKRHIVVAAAAVGAVLGVTIGLFLPIHAAPPTRGQALNWNLPSPQSVRRFDLAQYESLKTAGFWDTQAAARGTGTSAWTLRAIMTRPIAQVAVSTPGKNEQKWVRLGGTLPDGTILAAIDRDAIWFEQDGCRRVKRLYASTGKDALGTAKSDGQTCAEQVSNASARPSAQPVSTARPEPSGITPSNGK